MTCVFYDNTRQPSRQGLQNIWTASLHSEKKTNVCPGYGIKQCDDEALVKLELWGMQSTPSLPSLPDALRLGVIALERVLFWGQIELCYI